jgi:hypothetical protein
MTDIQIQDRDGAGRLLADLFTAAEPVLETILTDVPFRVSAVTGVELRAGHGPVMARVIVSDDTGASRAFIGEPYGLIGQALANALGVAIADGINGLAVDVRRDVAEVLHRGDIVVSLDLLFGGAVFALEVPGHRAIELFRLQSGDVH